MTGKVRLITCILLSVFITGSVFAQPAPLKIGVSKASPNYVHWLRSADPSIVTVDLYPLSIEEAVKQLSQCNGLLLTGGEDVYPGRYGKEYDTVRCTEMNPRRDTLDMALIEKALALKMPVVGVCRGHQILNVYLGGTLVIDIPQDIGMSTIHQCDDYLNCFHKVGIRKPSLLGEVSMCDSALVATNHHQAVDRIAPLLTASAFSADNIIEGIEWLDPSGKSFLLGVQWHPERMDRDNPLSGKIADEFLIQATEYAHKP